MENENRSNRYRPAFPRKSGQTQWHFEEVTTERSWVEIQDQESDISDYEVGMTEAAIGTSAKSEFLRRRKTKIPASKKPIVDLGYQFQEEIIDSNVNCYVLPSFLGSRIPQSPFCVKRGLIITDGSL
jgi:hypothetical protein